jgi:hypothetical protein
VTDGELEELITNCPTLFHMAERGSWPAIRQHGLLSTTALMDLYDIGDPVRTQIERCHRPNSVPISVPGLPNAVIRDQKPMSDSGLKKALPDSIEPSDWYSLLNSKVFFWTSEERLHRLTEAKAYREREHDVIEVDTRSLLNAHYNSIWLCPMNSGCTKPFPWPRDKTAFSRIPDYPYLHWSNRRPKKDRVVELAVDYSIPDIVEHVRRVVVKKGSTIIGELD